MKTMKFLNNLYTVSTICRETDAPYVVIHFNSNHEVYKAHFPSNPITPGVVLLRIATVMLEDIAGKHLRLEDAQNIKFYKSVDPDATVAITYNKLTEQGSQLKASIRIETEGVVYAKMTLVYNVL